LNPADYIYRYALDWQVECYLFTGWERGAYAGHGVDYEPVWFVKKRIRV
jgi:hypothetical protein